MEKSPEPLVDLALKNYKTLGRIGKGTYGSVFKAEHEMSGQIVAIKIINLITNRSEALTVKHLIMISREIYILYKLSKMKENSFTIRLFDI